MKATGKILRDLEYFHSCLTACLKVPNKAVGSRSLWSRDPWYSDICLFRWFRTLPMQHCVFETLPYKYILRIITQFLISCNYLSSLQFLNSTVDILSKAWMNQFSVDLSYRSNITITRSVVKESQQHCDIDFTKRFTFLEMNVNRSDPSVNTLSSCRLSAREG